jgi:hypothetical protein
MSFKHLPASNSAFNANNCVRRLATFNLAESSGSAALESNTDTRFSDDFDTASALAIMPDVEVVAKAAAGGRGGEKDEVAAAAIIERCVENAGVEIVPVVVWLDKACASIRRVITVGCNDEKL